MVGLTLVTVVAVLGAGVRKSVESAVTDQVKAAYIVDGPDGAAVRGRGGRRDRARTGREGGLARPRRQGARRGKEQDVTGVDPATIARFYTFKWTEGSERGARRSSAPTARSSPRATPTTSTWRSASGSSVQTAVGRQADRRRPRHLRPAARSSRCSARSRSRQKAFDEGFPQPKNSFTFLDAGAGRRPGAQGGRGRLRRRQAPHGRRVSPADATKGIDELLRSSTCSSPSRSS